MGANRGQQISQPFMQPPPPPELKELREVVQGLYGLGLRKIGYLEFYKPYSGVIDKENPYQIGHIILDFSMFSGEDGQSTLEHVAKFTVQCGELANYENFPYFKLKLFPNSLTKATFT